MATSSGQRAASMAVGTVIVLSIGGVWARQESADGPRAAAASALRAQGLQFGYNLDHADALAAFKDATDADPSDPTAYRLAAAAAWIGQARANLPRATPTRTIRSAPRMAIWPRTPRPSKAAC